MALQFRKCKTCGRIFQTAYGFECPDCIDDRERKFTLVKDYLYEIPGATMEEIVEGTGVEEELIIHFLKEGRLEMANAGGFLQCEKCGAPISSGTMCQRCKDKLSRAMESVLPESMRETGKKEQVPVMPAGKTHKMHIGDRDR